MYQLDTMINRNYLWFRKIDSQCSSKVAWNVIMLLDLDGDLGIIDPFDQSEAMLSKLIERGLLPGQEKWTYY